MSFMNSFCDIGNVLSLRYFGDGKFYLEISILVGMNGFLFIWHINAFHIKQLYAVVTNEESLNAFFIE